MAISGVRMLSRNRPGVFLLAALCMLAAPFPALAQGAAPSGDELFEPYWFGVGLGGGTVRSLAPAPSAGRNVLAVNMELGYRFRADWGVGLEFGAIVPFTGCAQWDCDRGAAGFAPNFSRFSGFAEYRPRHSGWRLRAGMGVSRFCYRSYWSDNAWSWIDTLGVLLLDDYLDDMETGSGAWRCDAARRALGGSVSAGYDWPLSHTSATMGLRLAVEAADFDGTPKVGMPAFRHRAVTMTLHLTLH